MWGCLGVSVKNAPPEEIKGRTRGAMAEIILRDDESLESGLRRFKRAREREGIVRTYKRNQFFTKPSDEKREAKKKAIRKLKKRQARASFKRRRS